MTWLYPGPDPSGYHNAASALRQRAEDLAYFAQRVERTVDSTMFEGPAADAFRSLALEQRSTVLHLSGELQGFGNAMSQAAARYAAEANAYAP